MALGAVEAYKAKNYDKSRWPIIYGIDGLNDALEAVEKGEIQGTIYNDKEDQAREMAILAIKIFQGEDLSSAGLVDGTYYTSQYQLVDSSNVEEFLQK
jgi:ABC-type sugar transport system substrate-binding protein